MKKTIWLILIMLAMNVFAETNTVVYMNTPNSYGNILFSSTNLIIGTDSIIDKQNSSSASGVQWANLGICTADAPKNARNISECSNIVYTTFSNYVQNVKTISQKLTENKYFELVKDVLKLNNDPRGDLPVNQIPKLSYVELDAILDGLYDTPSTEKKANKLSIKLLAIDNKLNKNDINWWYNASYHD